MNLNHEERLDLGKQNGREGEKAWLNVNNAGAHGMFQNIIYLLERAKKKKTHLETKIAPFLLLFL